MVPTVWGALHLYKLATVKEVIMSGNMTAASQVKILLSEAETPILRRVHGPIVLIL